MRCTTLAAAAAAAVLITACGGGGGYAGDPTPPPAPAVKPQVSLMVSNGGALNGTIVLTLENGVAPVTVANFLAYVNAGFYDGTVFHRHGRQTDRSTFVLQGGGYTAPVSSLTAFPPHKPVNAPIALEAGRGLSNLKYTVAMARTNVPNSATSEFFINTVDNAFLDTGGGGGYAVFATITSGTAIVDAMVAATCNESAVNFGPAHPDCVPEPNLVVTSARQTR